MKKTLSVSFLISALVLPTLAFAEQGSDDVRTRPPGLIRAFEHARSNPDSMRDRRQHLENLGDDGWEDDDHATSTRRMKIRAEIREHLASTTASTTRPFHPRPENASTTRPRSEGVPFLLRWLMGLPATTTVGEIRDEIRASTTFASTTASTTRPLPQGLGFLRNFWKGFGRFLRDN